MFLNKLDVCRLTLKIYLAILKLVYINPVAWDATWPIHRPQRCVMIAWLRAGGEVEPKNVSLNYHSRHQDHVGHRACEEPLSPIRTTFKVVPLMCDARFSMILFSSPCVAKLPGDRVSHVAGVPTPANIVWKNDSSNQMSPEVRPCSLIVCVHTAALVTLTKLQTQICSYILIGVAVHELPPPGVTPIHP
jgi:hypothetical protein